MKPDKFLIDSLNRGNFVDAINTFKTLPDETKADKEFIREILKTENLKGYGNYLLPHLPASILNDPEIMAELAIHSNRFTLKDFPKEMLHNTDFILGTLEIFITQQFVDQLPESAIENEKIVNYFIEAAKKDSYILQNSPTSFRANKKVVLEIINSEKWMTPDLFASFSDELKKDPQIVALSMKKASSEILEFVDTSITSDRDMMLHYFSNPDRKDSAGFEYIDEKLKNDEAFMKELVTKKPTIYPKATNFPNIMNNVEFACAFVAAEPTNLKLVPKQLQIHPLVATTALKSQKNVDYRFSGPYDQKFYQSIDQQMGAEFQKKFSKEIIENLIRLQTEAPNANEFVDQIIWNIEAIKTLSENSNQDDKSKKSGKDDL